MNRLRLALLNVRALRRRLIGLIALVTLAVTACTSTFAISQSARGATRDRVQESAANRSILIERLGERDDTTALTQANLESVRAIAGVHVVEPVTQASFGLKDDRIPGVLLYATTPRESLPPPIIAEARDRLFPLKSGEAVLPARADGADLRHVLGRQIRVQVTKSSGRGEGTGVMRTLEVVGLFDPSWQIDGPNAAYVDPATAIAWAALRTGVPSRTYADVVGYESATVVAASAEDVPQLLSKLQSRGFAASSLQQQLDALPGVLDLIRVVGMVMLISLVLLTGVSAYQVTAALGRQRRREIGILKAVGYTDGAVFRLLASEATMVGLVGAALGLIGAVLAATAGGAALRSRPDLRGFLPAGVVTPSLMTAASAVTTVVMVVVAGALLPAIRAARLSPAEAVRQW